MNRLLSVVAITAVFLLFAGCMGTFETARVVPLKIGATYFTTVDSNEDDSYGMPGIIVETGWPAGPSRFGIGLHLRAAAFLGTDGTDDNGVLVIWGSKLQLPQNSIADIALGVDFWGYYPGEIKLLLSRRIGILEPYACVGVAAFLDANTDIDILATDGLVSYTFGTMIEFGSGSGWILAAEIEGGDVWASPGVGLGLTKEF